MEFKIDVNTYSSSSYPVALYYRRSGKWWPGKWVHLESFKSIMEARAHYEKTYGEAPWLPIMLHPRANP